MQVRVSVSLLVVVGAWSAHAHMDGDCAPPSVDYGQLAKCNAFHGSTLPDYLGLTQKEVAARLAEEESGTTDDMRDAYEALMYEEMGEPHGEDAVMQANIPPVDSRASSTEAALVTKVWNYYNLVCPRSYYWLGVTQWFFYNWYNGGYQYCWSYVPIWVTACQNRYCAWWFTNPYLMYYYYRCYPVYRVVHVWARCCTHTGSASDFTVTWYEKRYIRIYVPVDCCCRRYLNPYLTTATCNVPGT